MSRVLTGIQSSGIPHLGNILGAILPGIKLANSSNHEAFFFIANLHSFTSIKEPLVIQHNTYAVAAAWMAFGFDIQKHVFYRQSDIPEVCELAWYLNCHTPYPMLANAHSFKDKSEHLADVNAGLFTYPVLMAADILMYDANFVPVGQDQKQHLEMTRDMASMFNHMYGETFVIPESKIDQAVMTIPGTDGRKMSKSYHNFIDVLTDEKEMKKQVMKIVTDSTPLEVPKNPDTCHVFKLYEVVATEQESQVLADKYRAGNFGFGHAKQELFDLLKTRFEEPRRKYQELMKDIPTLEKALNEGAQKARSYAIPVLERVRTKLGLKTI